MMDPYGSLGQDINLYKNTNLKESFLIQLLKVV